MTHMWARYVIVFHVQQLPLKPTLFVLFFQLMLEAQNKRIDDLMERIRLQQEKLDKQNMRIRTLQSQVSKTDNRNRKNRNLRAFYRNSKSWVVVLQTL